MADRVILCLVSRRVIQDKRLLHHITPVLQIITCFYVNVVLLLLQGLLGLQPILEDVFEGTYCSTFDWVDESGCERCMTIIPGLLRRLSRSTTDEKAYEERIRVEGKNCPPQKSFFYCKHFTEAMDRCFIRELVRKVEFGCIENGQPNVGAIQGIVNAVSVVFGTRLCPNVGRSREKPFARAYRWDTEPTWEEQKIIFGQPDNEPIHNSDDEVYADPLNNPDEIVVEIPPDHKGAC
ncbi:hypothetical protein Salat_2740200 [Sesamum alatum]|uniref:Uncharacterized protein n=1 Tax=Sesamum alatum TaxID=300844 RepID=A0AAE1XK26_9LAMI|nr:hypothetical protein Salat_2740200 [Sesamum alatum]